MGLVIKGLVLAIFAVVATAFFNPIYFLRIPKVGFMFYALSGGPVPPYFDYTMFRNDSWLLDGDVVVAAGTKCGTNWLMTMVHELRTWNLPEERDFEDIFDVVPWAEFAQYPGITANQRIALWNKRGRWNSTKFPFRVFKSHMTPKPVSESSKSSNFQCLDVAGRPKVKYIAMTRDGRDVINSLESFLRAHSDEFRSMWGGFPPPLESIDTAYKFAIPDENVPILTYLNEWWPYRKHPNVLLLHYSDVYQDVPGSLRQIADFIGMKGITDEAFREIQHRVSIEYMKPRDGKYHMIYGKNLDKTVMTPKGGLIRKGGLGKRKTISEDQERAFREHMSNLLSHDDELMKWYSDRLK
mmetsp:Transcript_1598/g.1880  ORF Transcript_1598/g.1880 Transcript_1598/m.1880 type:complete len:354 (+) Transcript_1598:318-1379(+)